MKRLLSIAVTACVLVLTIGQADAVTFTFFDDDNLPPPLGPFSVQVSNAANLPSTANVSSSTNTLTETATVTLTGVFLGPNFIGESDTLVLTELPGLTDPSDVIIVSRLRAAGAGTPETGISIVFRSDAPGAPPLPTCNTPGVRCQPEFNPGTTTTANPFFNLPIFTDVAGTMGITGGLQINAFSDAEGVPEPTTLLLIGSGLVGLGALRYKRIRGR
jgi:hypothetical protein